jgi:hypothetical protein
MSANGGGPIFIVGPMGSGTTLMRLVLDSHEHIGIPPETGFMRGYSALRFTPFKHSGRDWTGRLGWSEEEFDALAREFYDRLFTRYTERHGKRRWGEKTPLHTWHVADMAKLFPDAQFVGVIRHPYGSISSNMRRFKSRLGRASWQWIESAKEVASQASRWPDRFVIVRYEDLVGRPEPVLRELLEWLGEPWSPAVLEHHEVHGQRGEGRVEGRSRADDPIDESRVAKWKTAMPEEHRRWLSARVERLAAFYGYDLDDPSALAPLSPNGSALFGGGDLEARLGEFADLDLRAGGKSGAYEEPYDPRKLMVLRRKEFAHLARPRGVRRLVIAALRLLPSRAMQTRVRKAVRRVRARLGLRAREHPLGR